MHIEDRVEGVQMPWQTRLSSAYARRTNRWTQVCHVPPLPTRQRYDRRSQARKFTLAGL